MKRLLLITFFFVLSFSSVFAQQNLEKSILWEIYGENLSKPSYLLGTFHMVCEQDLHVADKVIAAIDGVEQIALEVNLADIDELMTIQELMISPTTLSSQLSVEEREEFRFLLKSKYDIDLELVDNYLPIVLMGMFATKDISCSTTGYDMEILNIGLNKRKKIIGLERFKDQLKITNTIYTAKEILKQLKEEEDSTINFDTMIAAFNQEDIQGLYHMVSDPKSLSEEMKILLLDNRNFAWVEKIVDLLPKESTLFAVGAGHLGGEMGLVALLRKYGFKVTAVLN